MRETSLPGELVGLMELMAKNTFVCTSCGDFFSDVLNAKNGVRELTLTCGVQFNFYLMRS